MTFPARVPMVDHRHSGKGEHMRVLVSDDTVVVAHKVHRFDWIGSAAGTADPGPMTRQVSERELLEWWAVLRDVLY